MAEDTYCLHKSCSSLFRFEFKLLESTVTNPFLKTITRKEPPCWAIMQYIWVSLELHQELHLAATKLWLRLKKDCGDGCFEGKHYTKSSFGKIDDC